MPDPCVFTLMIEPVKQCNLACRYCYSDTGHTDVMPLDIFRDALEKVAAHLHKTDYPEIHILWHGGEPLLAGTDFFTAALDMASSVLSGLIYRHFIQTNGLLLNIEFLHLFKDNQVAVGISLDGPAYIHDQMRKFGDGSGSWKQVMAKLALMEKHDTSFGICMTQTALCRGQEKPVYDFFSSLGHSLRINPVIQSPYSNMPEKFLLVPGEYGSFLCRIFDQWSLTLNKRIPLSPIKEYLQAVLGMGISECRHQACCVGSHLGIKPDGAAVLCSPFEDIILGGIRESSVDDLFASSLCKRIWQRAEILADCRRCINRSICSGGCPFLAHTFGYALENKDPLCTDYKIIFDHMRQTLAARGFILPDQAI